MANPHAKGKEESRAKQGTHRQICQPKAKACRTLPRRFYGRKIPVATGEQASTREVVQMRAWSVAADQVVNFCGEAFSAWDPTHLRVLQNGSQLQLVLDQISGSGLGSQNEYMFGHFEIQMKVAPGNTAGTVTSFYLSSVPMTSENQRDELDFEFLGNASGEPYLLQTNIFTNGSGYKEQRVVPWFDPTASFHTYSISWTKQQVIFAVDGTAIRTFVNNEASGQLYMDRHPMGAFLSIWDGDDWATLGGLVKINWTASPFVASYKGYKADACIFDGNVSACAHSPFAANVYADGLFDLSSLSSVEDNFMVYNYCDDKDRFEVLPPECTLAK
ncbi:hypothetical protein GOP47_0012200 [Adiantum capillus-veneris]|uniref:Xyloglucan endotransglucosylase/hydrolase n=1 Tax=Adiantum capillus-veneris TaxID=13818 RepID=A0A9D4UQ87_ADICA|nr:hypothetical protein GOP47_0012200 [Adiantum capillus-veneris]